MTMISFRIDDEDAAELQRWAEALGIDRSQFLREALHRQITRVRSEQEPAIWDALPLTDSEKSLAQIGDWGPAEDWSDWDDATR